jgi:hypothetical protein
MARPCSPSRRCVTRRRPGSWRSEALDARTFGYERARQLRPGDLLYRAGPSRAALWTELFFYGPGVVTFYTGSATRPHFVPVAQPL